MSGAFSEFQVSLMWKSLNQDKQPILNLFVSFWWILPFSMLKEQKCYMFTRVHTYIHTFIGGPGSSVGIATDYGMDGPESNPGRDEIVRRPDRPWAHPASCKMGTGSFPGVKCGRGVLLTTHPLLVPRSWKRRAIPLPTIWATSGL